MKNIKKHLTLHNILRIIAWVIGGVLLAVVIAFLFGIAVQYLWNWLMPEIFSLGVITYWQAFGIVVLAKLLFGGLGHHGKDHDHDKCKEKHGTYHMRFDKEEKGEAATEEQTKHYEEFWEAEGKEAFDRFLEKKENQ